MESSPPCGSMKTSLIGRMHSAAYRRSPKLDLIGTDGVPGQLYCGHVTCNHLPSTSVSHLLYPDYSSNLLVCRKVKLFHRMSVTWPLLDACQGDGTTQAAGPRRFASHHFTRTTPDQRSLDHQTLQGYASDLRPRFDALRLGSCWGGSLGAGGRPSTPPGDLI